MARVHDESQQHPLSATRQDGVALTEHRIVEAATAMFVDHGYVGTSLRVIAEAAGVAPRTVSARFGSKAQLLNACIDASISGGQQPAAPRDQDGVRSSREPATVGTRIDYLVRAARAIMESSAALLAVGIQAMAVEPEIAEMWRLATERTLSDFRAFAERLAADGFLPADVTVEGLTDLLWLLTGPRALVSLRNDRGWTPDQFADWLGSTLRAFLTLR